MKSLLAAVVAVPLMATAAVATPEPTEGPGVPNVVKVLLLPLWGTARIQAALDPEKPSCWNEGSTEVAGCRVAKEYDDAWDNRPVPYGD